jgi:ribosomal protein L12E/L44/L45/RPP1/RPP2
MLIQALEASKMDDLLHGPRVGTSAVAASAAAAAPGSEDETTADDGSTPGGLVQETEIALPNGVSSNWSFSKIAQVNCLT